MQPCIRCAEPACAECSPYVIPGDAPTHMPLCPPCQGPAEEEASEDSGASEEGYQRSAELEGEAGPYCGEVARWVDHMSEVCTASQTRKRSRGEKAAQGLDVKSGSARGGGSGNGTNPRRPKGRPMIPTRVQSGCLAQFEELSAMRDRRAAVGPHPRWEETEVLLVIGALSGGTTVAEGAWASRDLLEAGGPLARESIALAAAQLRDPDSMLLVRAVRERCQKPNGTAAGIEAARGWMNLRVLELRCRLGAEIFYRAFRD